MSDLVISRQTMERADISGLDPSGSLIEQISSSATITSATMERGGSVRLCDGHGNGGSMGPTKSFFVGTIGYVEKDEPPCQ